MQSTMNVQESDKGNPSKTQKQSPVQAIGSLLRLTANDCIASVRTQLDSGDAATVACYYRRLAPANARRAFSCAAISPRLATDVAVAAVVVQHHAKTGNVVVGCLCLAVDRYVLGEALVLASNDALRENGGGRWTRSSGVSLKIDFCGNVVGSFCERLVMYAVQRENVRGDFHARAVPRIEVLHPGTVDQSRLCWMAEFTPTICSSKSLAKVGCARSGKPRRPPPAGM